MECNKYRGDMLHASLEVVTAIEYHPSCVSTYTSADHLQRHCASKTPKPNIELPATKRLKRCESTTGNII